MTTWDFLKDTAKGMKLLPGMTFETTLLGRVPYVVNRHTGEYESVIEDYLQRAAERNGFTIVAADFKRNAYVLRLL